MNVLDKNNINTSSPNFHAKFRLSDASKIVSSNLKEPTNLDIMFNESPSVRAFEQLSIFLKRNVEIKYFNKPKNAFTKLGNYIAEQGCKLSRKMADRLFFFKNKKEINKINRTFVQYNTDSPEYIEEIAKIGNSEKNKYININLEDKPLENITNSKNAVIFVLNHPNYHKDKFSYVVLNSLINKMYVEKGMQNNCPRPKILVSQNMLKIVKDKIANIYLKLGMIPINGVVEEKIRKENISPMSTLMKDFIKNKSNIFIFPEGRNEANIQMPIEERIQPGVAKFINSAIKMKKSVKVVPVGLHYTKDSNNIGNVFIGKPLFFKKDKTGIIYTTIENGKRKIAKTNKQNAENSIFNEIKNAIILNKQNAENMS